MVNDYFCLLGTYVIKRISKLFYQVHQLIMSYKYLVESILCYGIALGIGIWGSYAPYILNILLINQKLELLKHFGKKAKAVISCYLSKAIC